MGLKRKILITGTSGLVGSHVLLDVLQKTDTKVHALKRKNSNLKPLKNLFDWHGKLELLEQVNWIEFDLRDDQLPPTLPDSIDELIHTAAIVSFNPDDNGIMEEVNVKATELLINYARQVGVKKFGFVSSIAALGRVNTSGKYTEDSEWVENESNSFYSKNKYESERMVLAANSEEMSTYLVNPGVILGPCDWGRSSGTFFRTGAKGIAFYTRGANGFVDVRDVSRGLLEVMKNGPSGERHILVSESLPYKQVFTWLAVGFRNKPPRIYSPQWLTGLGWRLDKVRSKIKGTHPTLTKETARNANGVHTYDNSKMMSRGFEFIPIEQSIREAIPFFKKYYF